MLASEVITEIRENVLDTEEEYRHSDAEMLRALTDASYQLSKDRPDLLIDTDGTILSVSALTAVGDTVLFGADMKDALASWSSYKLLKKDGEDSNNIALAGVHLQTYQAQI